MTLPPMSEADFSGIIEDLLTRFGWLWVHFRPARVKIKGIETYRTALTGDKGFPDIVASRRGRVLFLEVKTNQGKVSKEQQMWLDTLRQNNRVETYVWRPETWDADNGQTIVGILR